MFIVGNFITATAEVLHIVLTIYMWVVIIAALISWVNPDPYNPIVRFLYGVTEPVFGFVRRHLPLPPMGIDISPIIVLLAILFLQYFLVETLRQSQRACDKLILILRASTSKKVSFQSPSLS